MEITTNEACVPSVLQRCFEMTFNFEMIDDCRVIRRDGSTQDNFFRLACVPPMLVILAACRYAGLVALSF